MIDILGMRRIHSIHEPHAIDMYICLVRFHLGGQTKCPACISGIRDQIRKC